MRFDCSGENPIAFTPNPAIKVLAFDVFGTVVDWHGSIVDELQVLAPGVDGSAFANAWRAGYRPAMAKVMSGQQGWTLIDDLHRQILDTVLPTFGLGHWSEAQRQHLNQVWHRLNPWPDSVAGLMQLKRHFLITTLSNGNLGLLTHMAKRAGLPWDCLLSAEVFKAYKPDPATYLGVSRVLGVTPQEVMLVAAHHDDLQAARACGLRTAYVERPWEFSRTQAKDVSPEAENDVHVRDFFELAQHLGCQL